MAQVPCVFLSEGDQIEYTPVADVTAGDVVVLASKLVCIAKRDIAANVAGSLSTDGKFIVPKTTATFTQGEAVYYDADADPVDGTAGSGAFTDNSSLGPFAGWAAAGAATGVATLELKLDSTESGATTLRSALGQDDLAVYRLDLDSWKTTVTGQPLGATAGTPAGAFGITYGTHGTAAPQIVGEAASGNTKTDKMRRTFTLPPEYVAGQTVTLRVVAKETVGAATVSTTVDAEVFEVAAEAGLGGSPTDLCETVAADVTTAVGNKDFVITPTDLTAGDELDIEITGVTTDTGGTVGTILAIYDVSLLLDIKG